MSHFYFQNDSTYHPIPKSRLNRKEMGKIEGFIVQVVRLEKIKNKNKKIRKKFFGGSIPSLTGVPEGVVVVWMFSDCSTPVSAKFANCSTEAPFTRVYLYFLSIVEHFVKKC